MAKPNLPTEVEVELRLDEADDPDSIRRKIAKKLGVPQSELLELELCRRAIDARRGTVRLNLLFSLGAEPRPLEDSRLPEVDRHPGIVIVGTGPAGLLCAYELARHRLGSVLVERGQPVDRRTLDLQGFSRGGEVNPESNYCFGEGGAGTFSDGKLYTRSHKRGRVRDVLEVLVAHGASPAILTDARPHVGSDRLPPVVTALRQNLEQAGVEYRFGTRVVDLLVDRQANHAIVQGVRLADGTELLARAVVLATGHSAHDVYAWLARQGVALGAKGFALGVRVEHPQTLIDRIQYGAYAGHARLGAATYRVAEEIEGRGVFSFCMCPGGFIVPASTEPESLVVNGMSLVGRDSPYANSGLVVAVTVEDLARAGFGDPLGGLELQRAIERRAYQAGGGGLRAPAVRVPDFLARRTSGTLPGSSYAPGLVPAELDPVLDPNGLVIAERLRKALATFGRRLEGYLTAEAVLVGVETRTSSPVRILRDPETFQAPGFFGLYPAGEGAGYAGGIMSSAVDGINVARRILKALSEPE